MLMNLLVCGEKELTGGGCRGAGQQSQEQHRGHHWPHLLLGFPNYEPHATSRLPGFILAEAIPRENVHICKGPVRRLGWNGHGKA